MHKSVYNDLYSNFVLHLITILFQINFNFELKNNFQKMDIEFNRYYAKIQIILRTDSESIHEKLTTAWGLNAPAYLTVASRTNRFCEGREITIDEA